MQSDHPFLISAALHPEFYENIERYTPADDFISVARQRLDDSWSIRPSGFWTHCVPSGDSTLQHGWKIHVSTVPWRAVETLERVIPVLLAHGVAFKFCSDPWMLRLSLSKNWSRAQAGKFVAVYPHGVDQFTALIEELHQATADLKGPYVLTDRPYRDSRVVFYRYGEHRGISRPGARGYMVRGYRGPDGEWFNDERRPYFHLPEWVEDPFSADAPPEAPGEDGVLLNDRYRVTAAMKFSAVGGIYEATDETTGETVVVREARPGLGAQVDGSDGISLLAKESRILQALGPEGLSPRHVELFQHWEHQFLVQERLDAESLWGYSMNFYFSRDLTPRQTFEELRRTIITLIEGLRVVHDRGIVLRDLTKNNVMFNSEGEVKFIDFEFAYEMDRDDPPIIAWTAGYASPNQIQNQTPTPEDDHYALGALILDIIAYTASGYPLNREGILLHFEGVLRDLGLPRELHDLVVGLTTLDPEERWDLDRAEECLRTATVPSDEVLLFHTGNTPPERDQATPELVETLRETLAGILEFFDASAEVGRNDRLWPASAQIFSMNPTNLQYGATGPALCLLRTRGEVGEDLVDWIDRRVDASTMPPGLYTGTAGVALLFQELGRSDRAREIFESPQDPDAVHEEFGLYFGAAGRGLAALHLWRGSGDEDFLSHAEAIAGRLLEEKQSSEEGVSWPDPEGGARLGLGEGQTGAALFLLYLHAATGNSDYLETAARALDFDIAHRQDTDSGVAFFPRVDSPPGAPKSPHTWFGSAGVGSVAVRLYRATGETSYLRFAERCAHAVSKRFTNKIWHEFGLAGFGELMNDMARFTGDENYRNNAFFLAEALLPQRIFRPRGIAFAGEDLFRICCDFGCGSAGIGLFLQRLLHPETPRLLMLDDLLEERATSDLPEMAHAKSA